jgi:putative ABC transport system ATP-binding protein
MEVPIERTCEFEVDRLSLAYPQRYGSPAVAILNDVSFHVERGSTMTLVGPSGSGKSTVLRCLNRLTEPTAGCVRFKGRDIRSMDPLELRRRVALVQQTPVLFDGTVRDNLRMQPRLAPADVSAPNLERALVDVGLEGALLDRESDSLSGGEKQRVTIARALLGNPEALLLDEPTAALDPQSAALVIETIAAIQRARALTIVCVTHQLGLVTRLGGSLLYLVKGEVHAYERTAAGLETARNGELHAFLWGGRDGMTP